MKKLPNCRIVSDEEGRYRFFGTFGRDIDLLFPKNKKEKHRVKANAWGLVLM
jgi:hypothetical protein